MPFESVHRLPGGGVVGYVKGAVEEVLARCGDELGADSLLAPVDTAAARAHEQHLTGCGLRVLAFARFTSDTDGAPDPRELTLLGPQAMHDPPRPEAVTAVAACRDVPCGSPREGTAVLATVRGVTGRTPG